MSKANFEKPVVPDFAIAINGKALPAEVHAHVTTVSVDAGFNLPAMFVFELTASDAPSDPFRWIDDPDLFGVGDVVEVKLGYANDLSPVITGEITGLEPEFTFNHVPRLIVRGYDRRHRLLRGRKTRTFAKHKDSEIAYKVASDAGLTPNVTDSEVTHEYVLQANQTDLEFLQERARRIHYEIVINDKTFFFRPLANTQGEVATLTVAEELLEFRPMLSTMAQISGVAMQGWDPKTKETIVGRAQGGDEGGKMGGEQNGGALSENAFGAAPQLVSHRPAATQAEIDQMAKAYFRRQSLSLIQATGICWGRSDVQPGVVLKVDGVGKRFSGQYYVTNALHRYTQRRGYRTHFTGQRNAL